MRYPTTKIKKSNKKNKPAKIFAYYAFSNSSSGEPFP
jgi:hypothetical protein